MSSQKIRIYEVAKELGKPSKEILEKAIEFGLNVKAPSSSITIEEAGKLQEFIMNPPISASTPPKDYSKSVEDKKQDEEKNKEGIQGKKEPSTSPKTKEYTHSPIEEKPQKRGIVKIERSPKPALDEEKKPIQEVIQQKEIQVAPPKQEIQESKGEPTRKRMGLRIVKKRSEEIHKTSADTTSHSAFKGDHKAVASLLMNSSTEDSKKKKRTERKKNIVQSHKKGEQRLDLLSNRDFDHFDGDDEEDEMILFDLTVRDDSFDDEEQEFERVQKPRRDSHTHRPHKNIEKDKKEQKQTQRPTPPPEPPKPKDNTIKIPEGIRAYEFADKVGCGLSNVIKILFDLGMMVTKNDFLDKDSIEILAEELAVKVIVESDSEALDYVIEEQEADEENLSTRPPVVTIMGHVDHGKTSLLDKIRNTKVASGEAGGITQHIGAYTISKNGKAISFIDTPGHEAFTEMRARGAGVTDIVIIVIAADDGIKKQTIEALDHAKSAGAPIIIAVNKIDKPDANPDKLKSEASELGYTPIEWGGDYEFIHISAKTGEGIDTLLETILIQAEILELKANPNATAKAVVIESSLEKGKGPVATVIVKNGTLSIGESIVADTTYGRVRALIDDTGKNIKSIGPSEVAVVTGLNEVPAAGAILMAVNSDSKAREYAEKRSSYLRQKAFSRSTKVSLDELSAMVAEGQLKNLPVIIKTDTQGSLEAIKGSLEKVRNDEVKVNIIHSGVGGITESDVLLAQTSDLSVILGFNVRPTGIVKSRARELGVEIKTYSIIYDLVNEIKSVLSGMMSPIIEEESTGQAEVRETFRVPKIGTVAGCFVNDGVIQRGIKARVIRDGIVIHNGSIASLKRFKDDAREVSKGFECGIMIDGFNDIVIGDVIETYKEIQKSKSL
ncbi:translation initiation factor IF-2 [Helicobacter monodelphidis]|uniref:translation initiation factor IF-2 n=1 Tax=Helicobacter sp. 15-1451 TaxID=2004995 RepID=UPI000DCF2F0D|nr:translation initiation factor IF-2 [Helicobacter sp. 15-1451]RAX58005.1 translation initiation factor IF-2 [Helicobacter sp. 15-1451]